LFLIFFNAALHGSTEDQVYAKDVLEKRESLFLSLSSLSLSLSVQTSDSVSFFLDPSQTTQQIFSFSSSDSKAKLQSIKGTQKKPTLSPPY
jgi:hypothetical protein